MEQIFDEIGEVRNPIVNVGKELFNYILDNYEINQKDRDKAIKSGGIFIKVNHFNRILDVTFVIDDSIDNKSYYVKKIYSFDYLHGIKISNLLN